MDNHEKTDTPSFLLYLGDCLEIMKQIPDNSVDAVITDPPYSSGGLHQGDRTKAPSQKYIGHDVQIKRADFSGDNKDQRSWAFWCILWLSECHRIAKEGSPICMFSDWRQLPTVTDVFQASGWIWRGIAVWDKTEACRPCVGRFSAQSEYIIWGSKGSMPLRKEVGCLPGVYRQMVLQRDKFHITGKPTSLMNNIVKICPPKGTILDPFMGSGTTGVAALNSGRFFIGIELEPGYFEIAQRRIEETKT